MFVSRANKVETTMSLCLGTNEILAYTSTFFLSFITATLVWKHYIKYLHDSNAVYSDAAV